MSWPLLLVTVHLAPHCLPDAPHRPIQTRRGPTTALLTLGRMNPAALGSGDAASPDKQRGASAGHKKDWPACIHGRAATRGGPIASASLVASEAAPFC